MSKWMHRDVFDNGLSHLRASVSAVRLIKAYTGGDSYATVVGNSVAVAAIVPADSTLSDAPAGSRALSFGAKSTSASADSGAAPDLHLAFLDATTSRVLWVTDESSNAVISSGAQVTLPAVAVTIYQPS